MTAFVKQALQYFPAGLVDSLIQYYLSYFIFPGRGAK